MRAAVWSAVLWSFCVSGIALAQDKAEAAPAAEEKASSQPQAPVNEATPAEEPKQAEAAAAAKAEPADSQSKAADEATAPAEAPKAAEESQAAEAPKGVDSAPEKTAEPARPASDKAAVGRMPSQAAFQAGWVDASPDEKALFLEAFGSSSKQLQERWDKATPEERRRILRANPLLSARSLKHRWVSATPEERAAFLEATPRIVQKVKEAWESASPDQRKMLALEHPYFARKAFHHGWMETTPQEKVAFLSAQPAIHAELKARWTGANASQRQWYAKNYPGIEAIGNGGHWSDASTEERALFLQANPAINQKARDSWQKLQPEGRAAMVRKWQGWPLHAYQAKLENAGKTTLVSTRAHPTATAKISATVKPGAKAKASASANAAPTKASAPAKAAKK